MKRTLLILLLLLGFTACNNENASQQDTADTSAGSDSAASVAPAPQAPAVDTMKILRTLRAEDAVEVIKNFYDALNKQEYARAAEYWANEGESEPQKAKGFEGEYSEVKSFTIATGKPEEIREADGILSVAVPLRKITMAMKSGETFHLKGTYTLFGQLIKETPQWRIRMMDVGPE